MDGTGEGSAVMPPPLLPARRYKGVRLRKWGRWVSEIRMPNSRERIWLGSYESAEKAALAFDAAAVCLRGPRAGSLNFPESPPDVQYIPAALLTPERIQTEATRHANRARPAGAVATTAGRSLQLEATAAARTSRSNANAMSMPSGDSAAAFDDVLDWSFMDALPSMPEPSISRNAELVPAIDDFMYDLAMSMPNAELVPAIDDFMYDFSQPVVPPSEEAEEDVIGDDGDDNAFMSDLWRFGG